MFSTKNWVDLGIGVSTCRKIGLVLRLGFVVNLSWGYVCSWGSTFHGLIDGVVVGDV